MFLQYDLKYWSIQNWTLSAPSHTTVQKDAYKFLYLYDTSITEKKGQMIYVPISPKNTRGWLPSMGKDAGRQSLGKCK